MAVVAMWSIAVPLRALGRAPDGNRYPSGIALKAMFKLDESMNEAIDLPEEHPSRFGAGKIGWVSVKFSANEPMDEALWRKWLAESYALAGPKRKT